MVQRPTVGFQVVAVSYARGTPVMSRSVPDRVVHAEDAQWVVKQSQMMFIAVCKLQLVVQAG